MIQQKQRPITRETLCWFGARSSIFVHCVQLCSLECYRYVCLLAMSCDQYSFVVFFFKSNSFFFYFSNFSSAFTIERINGRSATLTHNATLFCSEWCRLTWSKQFVRSCVNVKKCSNAWLANGSLTQSLQPKTTMTTCSCSAMETTQNRRDILFAIQEVGEPKNKRCNVRWLEYIINLYVKMCTQFTNYLHSLLSCHTACGMARRDDEIQVNSPGHRILYATRI